MRGAGPRKVTGVIDRGVEVGEAGPSGTFVMTIPVLDRGWSMSRLVALYEWAPSGRSTTPHYYVLCTLYIDVRGHSINDNALSRVEAEVGLAQPCALILTPFWICRLLRVEPLLRSLPTCMNELEIKDRPR